MKRKLRSMLSTALVVSMLGTMFSGTAFGAGLRKAQGLFEKDIVPFLMVTEYLGDYDIEPGYQETSVNLASPANALMASGSELAASSSELTASASELINWEYDEDTSELNFALNNESDNFMQLMRQQKLPARVNFSVGEGTGQYQGEVEIRGNWFLRVFSNSISRSYDRKTQEVMLDKSEKWASPSDLSNSSYTVTITEDGASASVSGTDVEINKNGTYGISLKFKNDLVNPENRTFDRIFKVELKHGKELIGYTYFVLPQYSKIDGKIWPSISKYLDELSDSEKGAIEELEITAGDITADEWYQLMNLPNLKRLYLSKDLDRVFLTGLYDDAHNDTLEEIYFNWNGENAAKNSPSRSGYNASVVDIPGYLFKGFDKLKKVSMPGVTSVGQYAFYGNAELADIDAPDLQRISNRAFEGCTSLSTVGMPELENMGEKVFSGCTSLTAVDMPKLYSMGKRAFSGCTSFKGLELPTVYITGDNVFENCTGLESIALPKLNWVESGLFKGCVNLSAVDISSAGYVIGNAFAGLSTSPENRIKLILPEAAPYIWQNFPEEQRFDYSLVDDGGDALTGSRLENAVTGYSYDPEWSRVLDLSSISSKEMTVEYIFAGESTSHIDRGENLLEIMQKISGNGSLSNVKWLSVAGAKLTAEDWSQLENLTALETLTVGRSSEVDNAKYATEIPENCKLPASLKWVFLNTVTKISASAFKNNTGLVQMRLESIKEIGDEAFAGCTSLHWLEVPNTPPTLGNNVFTGCTHQGKTIETLRWVGDRELQNFYERYASSDQQWLPWIPGDRPTPPPTPDTPDTSSPSTSGRDRGTHYGSWVQDARGWRYTLNGQIPSAQWGYLPYNGKFAWYYFDQDGYMKTGWFTDEKDRTYYLHPAADGTRGYMYTGWNLIDGKWYYFSTEEGSGNGMLLKNTTTPDGYKVDGNGVWVQ
ncbi:leucine-rich repeat domain-containing protein [Clostridium transplantifaecale]|uniref:leucine-rich repeat domain-containing protein n=1 Tax=Clostridium transplantifaecale TaxID=2479838 RepID=UPI0013DDCDCB|nr:leucine-rich repeat protein [Clostridium transplantifaecale]